MSSVNDAVEHAVIGSREVKSASRTVEVLEYLAERSPEPVKLREISEALAVPKSSLHALMKTLIRHGWVRGDVQASEYSIGIRALLAGTTYIDSDPYVSAGIEVLEELRETTGETVHLGRLDGLDIVYLATRESREYLRSHSRVGRRLPAYSTSLGKAILSSLPEPDVINHVPYKLASITAHTITNVPDLLRDLRETRKRGFSIEYEENSLGVACYAIVFPHRDKVADAISVSIPLARLKEDKRDEVVESLLRVQAKFKW